MLDNTATKLATVQKGGFRYNAPMVQVTLLGFIIFCTVGMFSSVSNLGAGGTQSLNVVDIANSILFACFAIGGIFSGAAVNRESRCLLGFDQSDRFASPRSPTLPISRRSDFRPLSRRSLVLPTSQDPMVPLPRGRHLGSWSIAPVDCTGRTHDGSSRGEAEGPSIHYFLGRGKLHYPILAYSSSQCMHNSSNPAQYARVQVSAHSGSLRCAQQVVGSLIVVGLTVQSKAASINTGIYLAFMIIMVCASSSDRLAFLTGSTTVYRRNNQLGCAPGAQSRPTRRNRR